jgi:NAD(P)H dehydrogenase (quinone)
VGKVGSVFTSSATQHSGQESTLLSFTITLLHHGIVVVGLRNSFQGQTRIDKITGGSPCGASTIDGGANERWPAKTSLLPHRFREKHMAAIAKKFYG